MSKVEPGRGVRGQKDNMRTLTSRFARWRTWFQAGFLLVWLDPLLLRMHNFCGPVFHCYSCPLATFACPIGVMAGFGSLHVFPFALIGMFLVIGGLFGAVICGWVCPFGFLQDLFGRISTPKLKMPAWTGFFRYVVLIVAVLMIPYFFGLDHPLYICRICPAGAVEGSVPNMVKSALPKAKPTAPAPAKPAADQDAAEPDAAKPADADQDTAESDAPKPAAADQNAAESNVAKAAAAGQNIAMPGAVKLSVLIGFVLAMLFIWRPWCTLFCPLGAIYGLFNRFSAFFLRFNPAKCKDCGLCHKLCRMGVKPDQRANDPRCIRCLECTKCGALTVGSIFKRSTAAPDA